LRYGTGELETLRLIGGALLTAALLYGLACLVFRSSLRTVRTTWLAAFALVISGGVTMMVAQAFAARWGIRTDTPRDGLWALMDGTAFRPFVYRRLAPDAVSVVTQLIEQHAPARLVDAYLKSSTLLRVVVQVKSRHESIAVHVAFTLVWLAWFSTVLVGSALLRAVRGCSWFEALISATLAICLIPLTLVHGGYIYDSVELLLWTSLILCLWRGWFGAVPFVFVALLFNKESVLACVPALYPLLRRRLGKQKALGVSVVMALASVAWLVFVRQRYAGLPGSSQEWHVMENLRFWTNPLSYLKLAAVFSPGVFAPRGAHLAVLLLLLIPIRFGWSGVAAELRSSTVILSSVMVPLMLLNGLTDETRALGTLCPFLLIICSEGLHRLFAVDAELPIAK
jgi:hypothetical protein